MLSLVNQLNVRNQSDLLFLCLNDNYERKFKRVIMDRICVELIKLDASDCVDRLVSYHLILLLEDYILPVEFATLLASFYDSKFINSVTYYSYLIELLESYASLH